MPPVARATPLTPKGPKEAALLTAQEASYPVAMRFYEAVAKRTGLAVATEKSSYNRIIRGDVGDLTAWRITIYADILGVPAKEFLRPGEEHGVSSDGSPVRSRVTLQSLADEVSYLEDWIARGFAALGVAPELRDEARRSRDGHEG
jgi:hypothetical protein